MLQKLFIQNYAIIEELEIEFSGKLNIITGETGAGKSIIVGALGLILGERADGAALLNRDKKCIVEGYFSSEKRVPVRKFLKENDLDADEVLVIRREISTSGKSRAFINDTPVNLNQLKELSALLVDLHQQFDTLELSETSFQREVLDGLANNGSALQEYQEGFLRWQQLRREFEVLNEQKQQFNKEYDYNRFQYQELEEAGFKENELEDTEKELKLLNHAEGIRSVLQAINYALQESDTPVVQQLKILLNQLHPYTNLHPAIPDLVQRLQSVQIELQDMADESGKISNQFNYDPGKTEEMNQRLSLGYKLLKKHGVHTTEELLNIRNGLAEKLQAVLNMDETISSLEKTIALLKEEASVKAKKISAARMKQVKPFEEKVNRLLVQVGMPNARILVEISETELNAFGRDTVQFLFDANKSGKFLPVGKVASGGELSRLMLCIKSLVAKSVDLPTLIFDEIDTGISGEAAKQVGIIMKELAINRQVISITHQPQIAGKADAHFFVYKNIVNKSVKTGIRLLNEEERITAIAKMLGGEKPTAAALENAREMIAN